MSETPEAELGFEEAFARLEALVEAMERGDTGLAELVAKFEQGSRLLRSCQDRLREAELRIEQLKVEQGSARLDPLSPDALG